MIDLSNPISRQQAITALRALSDEDGYINAPHEAVTDVVRGLPPVRAEHEQTTQPERGDSDKFGVKISETCEDCISRQAAIDAIDSYISSFTAIDRNYCEGLRDAKKLLNSTPSTQPEKLTDKEQRIFLSAMGREEKVCKKVDDEWKDCREPYEDSLVHVCKEIRRKVKGALWT